MKSHRLSLGGQVVVLAATQFFAPPWARKITLNNWSISHVHGSYFVSIWQVTAWRAMHSFPTAIALTLQIITQDDSYSWSSSQKSQGFSQLASSAISFHALWKPGDLVYVPWSVGDSGHVGLSRNSWTYKEWVLIGRRCLQMRQRTLASFLPP